LFHSLSCGLAHPLIHLGYAFELEAPTVASEALALACVCWNKLADVMGSLSVPSGSKTSLELLQYLQQENELPLFQEPGPNNISKVIENESAMKILMRIYEQWNAKSKSALEILEELHESSTLLFAGSHKKENPQYDFFLLHLVTAANAARILHAILDDNQKASLHCQLFMFSLLVYMAQQRPVIDKNLITTYHGKQNTWAHVVDKAVNTAQAEDSHLVKVLRALRDAASAYGDNESIYINSATKVVDTMEKLGDEVHWVGGVHDNDHQLNVRTKTQTKNQ